MEFATYYPTMKYTETPTGPLSPPYKAPSPKSTLSCFQLSDSAVDPNPQDHVYSHVDALVDGLNSAPLGDPLERFMGARKRFLGRSVEDILGLIYEREDLKRENILRILYESAHVGGHLRNLGDWSIGAFKDVDKTRSQLEKEIANLEKERRMEEVSCWRDVTRMKSELRETLKEFNHEKEKEGLLNAYEP